MLRPNKKNSWIKRVAGLFFLLGVFVAFNDFFTDKKVQNNLAWSEVAYISDYQLDQQLMMDARIDIQLSGEMKQAVLHEVPLDFITQVELSERYSFLGLSVHFTQASIAYQTRLKYIGYNKTYVLINQRNKQVQTFNSLSAALSTLGNVYSFPVVPLSSLHPNNTYQIAVKLTNDLWQLPAPLIAQAYQSQDWHIASRWHTLLIHTPNSWH